MTVQTNTNVASFNGNGVTQIFPIAFKFNNDTDLVVLLADDATGASSLLTLNSDYTVSGEGDEEGGLINVVVAPAVGKRLFVSRVVDILQMTDLRNQGKFFAEVHEDAFDLLTMIAQQHQSDIARSLRVAETDPEPARIPPVAQRAGKLLAFDADGNPTTALPVADSSTALREELGLPSGASIIGYRDTTVEEALDALARPGVVKITADDGENITSKLTDALASGARVICLPVGTFLFNNPLTIEPGFRGFVLEGAGILNTTLKATVSGQPSVVMARTDGSTTSFYQSLRNLSIDGDGKATYFRNASAYGTLDKVRSVNHVETNYHATGLINLHTGCAFPVNPNGVICSNATIWCSHNANYFQGCYVHGGGATGVAIRFNNSNGLESVKNSFHHCTIENGQVLVENGAYAVSFDDNYLEKIKIIASGNCDGLVITNNRGAEAQPFVHLNNVARVAAVKIADNNLSFDIYVTVNNREGAANEVLDFYQFPELHIHHNGRRQQPILINSAVACDFLSVQRARMPGDVSTARVSLKGVYKLLPAEETPVAQVMLQLYLRAASGALDGYFIEERTYARRPPTGAGGVDPYRANYWDARGYVEYPSTRDGTVGATSRTAVFEKNPSALAVTYEIVSNGENSKRWEMSVIAEANRETYYSSDFELTQIS